MVREDARIGVGTEYKTRLRQNTYFLNYSDENNVAIFNIRYLRPLNKIVILASTTALNTYVE